jgi:hypothetical protein
VQQQQGQINQLTAALLGQQAAQGAPKAQTFRVYCTGQTSVCARIQDDRGVGKDLSWGARPGTCSRMAS